MGSRRTAFPRVPRRPLAHRRGEIDDSGPPRRIPDPRGKSHGSAGVARAVIGGESSGNPVLESPGAGRAESLFRGRRNVFRAANKPRLAASHRDRIHPGEPANGARTSRRRARLARENHPGSRRSHAGGNPALSSGNPTRSQARGGCPPSHAKRAAHHRGRPPARRVSRGPAAAP